MLTDLFEMCGKNPNLMIEQNVEPDRFLQSPLHVAAAAGHFRAVSLVQLHGFGKKSNYILSVYIFFCPHTSQPHFLAFRDVRGI